MNNQAIINYYTKKNQILDQLMKLGGVIDLSTDEDDDEIKSLGNHAIIKRYSKSWTLEMHNEGKWSSGKMPSKKYAIQYLTSSYPNLPFAVLDFSK